MHLTTSHRVQDEGGRKTSEARRVEAARGKVARARIPSTGQPGGPLRAWPGGLSMGRSLGDSDCGDWHSPEPDVLSIFLPDDGCDIILASDGLWDAVSLPEVYALVERWPSTRRSLSDLVSRAVENKGVHDDITAMILRVVPSDDRKGYWTENTKKTLAQALGLKGERMHKPPSWHDDYAVSPQGDRSSDSVISVKGGEMFSGMEALNLNSGSPFSLRPP
jgi:hypothetical protein